MGISSDHQPFEAKLLNWFASGMMGFALQIDLFECNDANYVNLTCHPSDFSDVMQIKY